MDKMRSEMSLVRYFPHLPVFVMVFVLQSRIKPHQSRQRASGISHHSVSLDTRTVCKETDATSGGAHDAAAAARL